jgi:hypothetical protein
MTASLRQNFFRKNKRINGLAFIYNLSYKLSLQRALTGPFFRFAPMLSASGLFLFERACSMHLGLGLGFAHGRKAFTPRSIASLALWLDSLDPSTIHAAGGAVSQWNDKSGNGRNAVQASSSQQPVYNMGNGLTFDGVDDTLTYDGTFLAGSRYTIFVVEKSASVAGMQYFLAGTSESSNTNLQLGYGSPTQPGLGQWGNDFYANTGLALLPGITRVWCGQLGATGHALYTDGVLRATSPDATPLSSYTGATIGGRIPYPAYYGGAIKEIIIYNRALSANELAQVHGYLIARHESGVPLRVATVQNRTAMSVSSVSGANAMAFRWPHIVGQDMRTLVLSNYNWWQNFSAESNTGNTYTIVDAAIELGGSAVTVPVTFNGSRSITIGDNACDIQSDAIPAAAFGLTVIPKGTVFWTKMKIAVPSAGNGVPASNRAIADVAGSQGEYYATASTSVSSTDTYGPYATTGASPTAGTGGYCPIILGTPVADGRSFYVIGDSIAHYAYDNSPSDLYGAGFVQRAMRSASDGDFLPCINMARWGCVAALFANSPLWIKYTQYANRMIEELGTNDIGTSGSPNLGSLQNTLSSFYNYARFKNDRIVRTHLLPRASTTDSLESAVNQTPASGWGTGQASVTMNAWFDSQLAAGTLTAVVAMNSVRDPGGDVTKWNWVGGSPYYYGAGTDNPVLHPAPAGHEAMAVELRPVLRSL